MPNHRVSPGSLSVTDLLEVADNPCPSSHRAYSPPTGRFKAVAGVAVAAGALLTTGAHLSPVATAAPVTTPEQDLANVVENAAAPVEAAPAAPVSTPFGLVGLAPEVAAPLAQAEQIIKDIQQQVIPALPAIPALPEIPALPSVPAPPAADTTVLPVLGQISSGFGNRWGAFHYGVDIADPIGTPIKSAMSGTVLEAGPASGFGQWVRVQQEDGTIAVYGHVNDMYVQAGQHVEAGEVIASVGNRGNSTGPHLHLEIWDVDGKKVDPVVWLAGKGILMEQHWGAD